MIGRDILPNMAGHIVPLYDPYEFPNTKRKDKRLAWWEALTVNPFVTITVRLYSSESLVKWTCGTCSGFLCSLPLKGSPILISIYLMTTYGCHQI